MILLNGFFFGTKPNNRQDNLSKVSNHTGERKEFQDEPKKSKILDSKSIKMGFSLKRSHLSCLWTHTWWRLSKKDSNFAKRKAHFCEKKRHKTQVEEDCGRWDKTQKHVWVNWGKKSRIKARYRGESWKLWKPHHWSKCDKLLLGYNIGNLKGYIAEMGTSEKKYLPN